MATIEATRARLRELNDACRTGRDPAARIMVTATCLAAVSPGRGPISFALGQRAVHKALREFTFPDDDKSDHDMGWFEVSNVRVMFKVEYYDLTLKWGSENAADPKQTIRVLTVMLPDDY